MPVTTKDIARELGLSQPTVSRILNGAAKHASAATRARVLEAAQQMQYQPNAVARSLQRGSADCLGFHSIYEIYDYDTRNDFYSVILSGLQRACNQRGFDLMLYSSFRHLPPHEAFAKMHDGRIDGLFIHAAHNIELVSRLAASALNVVAIANQVPGIASVLCDNVSGIVQTVDFLWKKGYRRFAYLVPQMKLNSAEQRCQTFKDRLRERGGAVENVAVHRIAHEDPTRVLADLQGARDNPLAVCCWNDRTAYNLLALCLEHGMEVPAEVAVVGFDGFLDTKSPRHHLVTVACPWEEVASTALEVMIAQIKGEPVADTTLLPVALVEGDTA